MARLARCSAHNLPRYTLWKIRIQKAVWALTLSVPIGDGLAGVNRARNGDIYHMGQDGQIREGNTPPSKHWSWLINVPCTELEANFNPECAIRHFHACCRCLPSLHRLTAWGLGCSFQGRSVYGTSSGLKLTSSIPSALLRAQR